MHKSLNSPSQEIYLSKGYEDIISLLVSDNRIVPLEKLKNVTCWFRWKLSSWSRRRHGDRLGVVAILRLVACTSLGPVILLGRSYLRRPKIRGLAKSHLPSFHVGTRFTGVVSNSSAQTPKDILMGHAPNGCRDVTF